MIPASQRLYDAVINEKLVLPDLPELAQHAAGAIAKQSRRGWRVDRLNPRVEIDGVTALMMALDRLENRPAPVELLGWSRCAAPASAAAPSSPPAPGALSASHPAPAADASKPSAPPTSSAAHASYAAPQPSTSTTSRP